VKIPFLRPNLVKKEQYLDYLTEIDHSRMYSNYGPLNKKFETRVINEWFQGDGYCSTVNNATTGLILAISALKRTNAKYAVMPSFTFSATPLAAMWCGLTPYYIDICKDEWSMENKSLRKAIELLGDDLAIVIPYATFGSAIDTTGYEELHSSGIPVVIDAAASFGTTTNGAQFGQTFPGCVVYSFHATKAFGIGEGGMVYSGNPQTIQTIRNNGNFAFSPQRESIDLGMNSKISEFTAAIALATLDVYKQKIETRQKIHAWYIQYLFENGLAAHGWRTQKYAGHIPYQFMPLATPAKTNSLIIAKKLRRIGIEARSYFSPACHQQQAFCSQPHGGLGNTEELTTQILSLPLWEEMSESHVEFIAHSLHKLTKGKSCDA